MTTDKCAATIAEGKHGDFAEQNHVNASLGSYFPCLCAHLPRNDVDNRSIVNTMHAAEPYGSICTDINACLSTSRSQVYWQSYTFRKSFFPELPHSLSYRMDTHAHTLAQLCSKRYAVFTVSKHYSIQIYTYTDNGITVSEV